MNTAEDTAKLLAAGDSDLQSTQLGQAFLKLQESYEDLRLRYDVALNEVDRLKQEAENGPS